MISLFHALMTRSVRNDLASVAFAINAASFVTHFWLFFSYLSSRPSHPIPELGLLYGLNNHGSHVYLTATETTGLHLLFGLALWTFLAGFVIVPKDPVLPPPGTPNWLLYVGGTATTDLARPSARLKAIFLFSFILWLGMIHFAGPSIVSSVVRQGIIL
jgi:hypothetical protein